MKTCEISGCGRPFIARGYCKLHYQRWKRTKSTSRQRFERDQMLQWIHDHQNYSADGCLIWPFVRGSDGYPCVIWMPERRLSSGVLAHRLMCEAVYGPAPSEDVHAAHSCGKGHLGCIHPKHLRWASPKSNQADQVIHGTRPFGSRHPKAKLKERDIVVIKSSPASGAALAKKFGVSQALVSGIRNGKKWAHAAARD